MGKRTAIEWCDHTFNPWIGCSKVSGGCKNCYAETQTYPRISKARGLPLWGFDAERHRTSDRTWANVKAWARAAAKSYNEMDLLGTSGHRRRVFCASLSDVFEDHPQLPPWRADLWRLIEQQPELDWLLLTKRPENVRAMVPKEWLVLDDGGIGPIGLAGMGWPGHVWLGVSAENNEAYWRRIGDLARAPAAVRFLSLEPLLGSIYLGEDSNGLLGAVDWVIVGGESGPNARPCHVEWIADVVAQCAAAGVPCFVKQMGSNAWDGGTRLRLAGKGDDWTEWPSACRKWPREWPKGKVAA